MIWTIEQWNGANSSWERLRYPNGLPLMFSKKEHAEQSFKFLDLNAGVYRITQIKD